MLERLLHQAPDDDRLPHRHAFYDPSGGVFLQISLYVEEVRELGHLYTLEGLSMSMGFARERLA